MNNNPIKRKTSFWSIIKQVYGKGILVFTIFFISIPAGVFIPYWAGQLLYKIIKIEGKGFGDYWFPGFLLLSFLALIIKAFLMLVSFTKKLIESLIIAKKIAYLPTTKEELEALNINTFDEFYNFMLDFFGIHKKTLNTLPLWYRLSCELSYCYELLPPPENNAHLKAYKKDKEKYARIHAQILADKIMSHPHHPATIKYMKKLNKKGKN